MSEKEKIIESIANRITVEHLKHKDISWAKIAAHKIYVQHFEKADRVDDMKNKMFYARATLFPNKTMKEVYQILESF